MQRDTQDDYELVDVGPDDDVAATYVVSEMGGFSMNSVRLQLDHYTVTKIVNAYRKDIAWIEWDWSKVANWSSNFERT
ncbi:hypothetical protein PI124_g743 [Phytophthora idaei]|nr:hypothetical protein PI124_g743 [Phytophthora idaei]